MRLTKLAFLLVGVLIFLVGCKKAPSGPLTPEERTVVGKWRSAAPSYKSHNALAALFAGNTKFELKPDRNFVFSEIFAITGKWAYSGDGLVLHAEQVDGLTQKGIEDARIALDKAPSTGEIFGSTENPAMKLRMQEQALGQFEMTHKYKLSKSGKSFRSSDDEDSGSLFAAKKFVRDVPVPTDNPSAGPGQYP